MAGHYKVKVLFSQTRTIVSFFMMGRITAGVQFFSFALLLRINIGQYLVAVTISYLLAMITNFIGHRFFTFKNKDTDLYPQITKYILTAGINYFITLIVVYEAINYLYLTPYTSVCLSMIVTVLFGYTLLKYWVFKLKRC